MCASIHRHEISSVFLFLWALKNIHHTWRKCLVSEGIFTCIVRPHSLLLWTSEALTQVITHTQWRFYVNSQKKRYSISFFLSLCVHTLVKCMSMWVCVHECLHVYRCVWRSQGNFEYCSSGATHQAWNFPGGLGWLASEPQRSSSSWLPSGMIKSTFHQTLPCVF